MVGGGTGTVIPPSATPTTGVPATPSAPDEPLLSDPAGLGTNIPVSPGLPGFAESNPDQPAVTGAPGMTVNCQMSLPCRWISADTQFSVTVSNADNIGDQGRLSIEYSLLTSHDTQVSIASTEPATDDRGVRNEPASLVLGDGVGGRAQGVVAGTEIPARIEFERSSSATSLSNWTIGLSDAGLVREPSFTGIPVGSVTNQHADCANTLPCAWVSPTEDVTITLLSANGLGATNRLSANFKIETTRNASVALDAGATAVGTDGMQYNGRTHAIGTDTSAEKITATAIPGSQVAGTVHFFRTQSMSTALQNLSLVIYEDRPVPRWNPSFLSIPIQ